MGKIGLRSPEILYPTDIGELFVGDPTDATIKLRPLEPASGQALARDLVLKTRRRKGLGDQIAVSKYLDDEFVVCFLWASLCAKF